MEQMKRCPSCDERIRARAIVCRHCGHQFRSAYTKEEVEAQKGADYRSAFFKMILFVIAIGALIYHYGPKS